MGKRKKALKKYPDFSQSCFWDMDYTKLDFDAGKRYIITRVVSHGGQDDLIELFNYYGWDTIKEEVVHIRYLNSKILNFLSLLFEIDIKDFRANSNRNIF